MIAHAKWIGEAILYFIGLPLLAFQVVGLIDALIDLFAYLSETMRYKS
ncbi:hypothetical protein BSNK01_17270 [Bacillaceae bacterium]